ncbi:hypothetical protein KUV44_08145 [Marinobacter daepoensis]|uniref:Uncharacterized protein n=1 Tax=Marinobacter daepoensis TaxID=262077 RepID=A0ABS3BHK2_9GAMM|nr:hypothetical protein [Marinobacter daepoensis]MBN7771242.1 hypothetical protein [Marinobacter daepoensis]MBY6079104.1 hypothetical protein [Marinobacter daepoensis]
MVNAVSQKEKLSDSELLNLPVKEIQRRLVSANMPSSAQEWTRQLHCFQKAYRRACFSGDLKRVRFFLQGLPLSFLSIRDQLLDDKAALSWAAYGGQADVIAFICSQQDDESFIGFDYGAGLEVLVSLESDEFARTSEGNPLEGRMSSALAVVSDVASEINAPEILRALEERLTQALDQQIELQMTSRLEGGAGMGPAVAERSFWAK